MILAIDPGVSGTGWAKVRKYAPFVLESGTFRVGNFKDWLDHANQIADMFYEWLWLQKGIEKIVIEMPRYMGNAGGRMVAVRGDLTKLGMMTGMLLAEMRHARPEIGVLLVEPQTWKGQLPKEVCRERIKEITGLHLEGESEHAFDAMGIGLWAIRKF